MLAGKAGVGLCRGLFCAGSACVIISEVLVVYRNPACLPGSWACRELLEPGNP
jgi:hypothetical protein